MYNRYIRNDRGTYTRITEDDGDSRRPQNVSPPPEPAPPPPPAPGVSPNAPPRPSAPPQAPQPPQASGTPTRNPPPGNSANRPPPPPPPHGGGLQGFLRNLLHTAHTENVDAGDLLILCLLFLLYREGADEETLIALALLLIL
jgi:hypothetical protein